MNERRTNAFSGKRLGWWVILVSIAIILFASGWVIGALDPGIPRRHR